MIKNSGNMLLLILGIGMLLPVQMVFAQRVEFPEQPKPPGITKYPSEESKPLKTPQIKTMIDLEVLVPVNGTGGLVAQEWGRKLQGVGITPLFRTPRLGDGNLMEEKKVGQTRFIKMQAILDGSGKLTFPNKKSFTLDKPERLVEWIHEVEAYGIQGKPDGQPTWGLTPTQFEIIFAKLTPALEVSTKDQTITDALKPWEKLHQFPLVISAKAREDLLQRPVLSPVKQEYQGLSLGTGLAILLSEYELTFYPERTAAGTFQLRVERKADFEHGWPVGYTLESRELSRQKTAPLFFKVAQTQYLDQPLDEIIKELSTLAKIPIYLDYTEISRKSITPANVLINIPLTQSSPSLTLRKACIQGKLTQDLYVDESGKPFVWVTPFSPKLSEK